MIVINIITSLPHFIWFYTSIAQSRVDNGGWAPEGLEQMSNKTSGNLITVECNSTHLTSFAVLMDVAGGQQVRIMTYY